MIYIIDTDRESTLIHRIDLEKGKYLMPKRVKGTLQEQTQQIVNLVEKEEPIQIIFDKGGFGIAVADMFPREMYHMRAYFTVDEAGNITHNKY
jgi:hypothetical protein